MSLTTINGEIQAQPINDNFSFLNSDKASLTADNTFTGITQFNNLVGITKSDSATSTLQIVRDADFVGGTSGVVHGAIYLTNRVGTAVTSYEWGITSILNNYSLSGEHVAIYGQGNKYVSGGTTWAGVFEAHDRSGTTSGTLVGLEVDVFANGDGGTNRVGLDMVFGRNNSGGTINTVYAGIRLVPQNTDSANATLTNGILLQGSIATAVNVVSNGTFAFRDSGINTVGIDLSQGTHSSAALRIGANEYLALEGTSVIKMKYNPSNGYIEFYNGAARVGYIDMAGADHAL